MKKVKFGYESVNVGDRKDLRYKGVVYIGRANKDEVKEIIKKSKIIVEWKLKTKSSRVYSV